MTTRAIADVDVYKGKTRVGQLRRTSHGARFEYDPAYAAERRGDPTRAVAYAMPVRSEPYEVFGVNLHPFFAGLLPEGLRLQVLTRVLKTSADDLFSLLVASGADTVGDVCVAPAGTLPAERAPLADTSHLGQLSFRELLEESLRYEEGRGDFTAIAGVQPKVSAAMISFPLRARDKRRTYILKLTPDDYPKLAENEAFFMALTKAAGFEVARTQLTYDREGRSGLLVERFDRATTRTGELARLHQEDGCQLLDLYPADKYRLTLADLSRALEVCSAPVAERFKLLRLQALAYLIANGDLHAKNISVLSSGSRVALTPVYDMLSTLPYGDRSLALSMEGRDDRLKASHFVAFGERIGLRRAAIEQALKTLCARVGPWIARLPEIGLDERRTNHLARTMRERLSALSL